MKCWTAEGWEPAQSNRRPRRTGALHRPRIVLPFQGRCIQQSLRFEPWKGGKPIARSIARSERGHSETSIQFKVWGLKLYCCQAGSALRPDQGTGFKPEAH